jgi:hypothetical protein
MIASLYYKKYLKELTFLLESSCWLMSISTDFKQSMDVGEQKREITNRIKSRYSYGKIYAKHDTIIKGEK